LHSLLRRIQQWITVAWLIVKRTAMSLPTPLAAPVTTATEADADPAVHGVRAGW
jgi:hypothetical protein